MALTFLSRKIVFRGFVLDLTEEHVRFLENYLKEQGSGESLEDAIERLWVEEHEKRREQQEQQQL